MTTNCGCSVTLTSKRMLWPNHVKGPSTDNPIPQRLAYRRFGASHERNPLTLPATIIDVDIHATNRHYERDKGPNPSEAWLDIGLYSEMPRVVNIISHQGGYRAVQFSTARRRSCWVGTTDSRGKLWARLINYPLPPLPGRLRLCLPLHYRPKASRNGARLPLGEPTHP